MQKVRVVKDKYRMLDGSYKRLVKRVGDGSIIRRFDNTPIPRKLTDVICPHFLELKWAYGCPFNCAWCYLKGTLRFLPKKTKPVIKNYNKVRLHLESFFNATKNGYKEKEVLNTGEIADSLMYENNGKSFSKFIISIFDNQSKHKVLFLTKSNYVNNILKIEHNGSLIMSFTLNAFPISRRWEKGAPSTIKRIRAARKLSEIDDVVRIRIDPMVPVRDWRIFYKNLIDKIFSNFTPERITLGSLRGLQSTINNCTDKTWVNFLDEKSNWGKKISFNIRYDMYSVIINYLKTQYQYKNVALCKETKAMWKMLKMDYRKIKCNCVW